MASQTELEESTRKTVLLYNRLNSPKAVAKIVIVRPEQITIAFSGSFCYECGGSLVYIEEFARDFKVFNNFFELSVGQTRQTSPHSFEVDYKVKTRKHIV
ncbi:MAG: hypothetical protein N3F10_03215 [Candidatus Bathyarchaeota archaeon]|nr:hypothetical protein [Candidatus Bathyarchaeota archaeon]